MSDKWHFALFEFELLLVQSYLFRPVYAVLIPYLQDFIDPIFTLGKIIIVLTLYLLQLSLK